METANDERVCPIWFQCSSASRKFLNASATGLSLCAISVSVLFSEPKIPQTTVATVAAARRARFSALQRAENSSIRARVLDVHPPADRFSALQRAENSSMLRADAPGQRSPAFQCSSASRKFLNASPSTPRRGWTRFQCSSASRKFLNQTASANAITPSSVSVLFSEPKIPQYRPAPQERKRSVSSTTSIIFEEFRLAEEH